MKWKPKFRPTVESVVKKLVWLRFSGLPSKLVEEEIIASIRDMVGWTIRVDTIFLTGTRGKFARACVEVDLLSPLIPSLINFNFRVTIKYEGLHLIYFKCGCYVHQVKDFKQNQTEENSPIESGQVGREHEQFLVTKWVSYGPWMF